MFQYIYKYLKLGFLKVISNFFLPNFEKKECHSKQHKILNLSNKAYKKSFTPDSPHLGFLRQFF